MKNKRPDRDFYHHPRYKTTTEDYGNSRSVRTGRTILVASTEPHSHHKDRIGSLHPHHSQRKSLVSETKNTRYTQDCKNTNNLVSGGFTHVSDLNSSFIDGNTEPVVSTSLHFSDSRSISTNRQFASKPRQESFATSPSVQNSRVLTSTSVDLTPENSTEKHGGLILLPKDVDIFQQSTQNPKSFRREAVRSDSTKPVVVVRPSFSNPYNHSRTTSTRLDSHGVDESKCISQCKEKSDNDMSSRCFVSDASTESPTNVLPVPWTDAAKAAFYQFFKTQTKFSSSSSLQAERPSSTHHFANQPTCLSPGSTVIQPPNEMIASTMQQIVQLDATLSALLIPPGLCAQSMVLFEPLQSDPELGREWTESEALFLRWWGTVKRLRDSLFLLFESVIVADLDFCNTAHVEQGMWKSVFYTVLESLRSWVGNPQSTQLIPKLEKNPETIKLLQSQLVNLIQKICLSEVIDSGSNQLASLLERIQSIHHIQLGPLLSDGRPPPETKSRTRRLVYLSAQKLMLFLGDLARYRETLVGERNFGKARNWYQKAQLLVPKNGRSYNQLAVLALYTSRHLDAMFYYMRTLAASNPFATASQSLAALFNEIRPRAQNMIMQFQKPKTESVQPHCSGFSSHNPRFQRAEIWIHPIDGQTTVIQGGRRLMHSNIKPIVDESSNIQGKSMQKLNSPTPELEVDNEDEDDEEAQAEAEEYANISLIELSKQFGLEFIHAHGKLYTKIGMETFPEVASLTLQALSGLLAQKPCPLSTERLCQLFVVNMFNVDRAASMTNQTNAMNNSLKNRINESKIIVNNDNKISLNIGMDNFVPSSRLTEIEALRSVHHDHAARFALDTFSLVCRRAAQLLQETPPMDASPGWLSPDARILLSALCLWTEWMILHPEHWLPPPNHRDPTLRPHLDDWLLVAKLCTEAASWLARLSVRPKYEEITPTTSLVLRLKGEPNCDEKLDDDSDKSSILYHIFEDGNLYKAAFLSEEVFVAGFKPMLDLTPKIYYYTGDWDPETVADFVRIEKLVLFGDYLCGIETPVLSYNIERAVYESVIQRESSERVQDKRVDVKANIIQNTSDISLENEEKRQLELTSLNDNKNFSSDDCTIESNSVLTDIAALQRQRAFLQKQLDEEARLDAWRRNAIRQAASGGQRAVEIEVRPIYLLPDTNCYIDWLEGIATLAQKSSNYTVLVPIVVVNELDTLSRFGSSSSGGGGVDRPYEAAVGGEVTRAGLIQERAKLAINYLEYQFDHRNSRLRALTARGSLMETIAYRNEINGGRTPGQTNDDVILTCCQHFCKEDSDRFQLRNLTQGVDHSMQGDQNNQPVRLVREVVLLTSDRNLRLKALNVNIPARPLRTFVNWSRLPLVKINLSNETLSDTTTTTMNSMDKHKLSSINHSTKPQPRGQWKQPLKYN
ncbi:unnamed protein product [Schistosoma intercalatum]|nr:unnamed protein product [Schistosoma intercalatum]CAH8495480.1 unnamed protein product [Schistosoma intercalatum]